MWLSNYERQANSGGDAGVGVHLPLLSRRGRETRRPDRSADPPLSRRRSRAVTVCEPADPLGPRFARPRQGLARGSAPSSPKDARAPLLRACSPSVRAVSGRARWSLARRLRSRSMARAGAVHVRLRAIVGRRELAGGVRAAAMTVRRSAGSAPATGFGGRCPPPARCPGSGAGSWGFKGGAASPWPDRNV